MRKIFASASIMGISTLVGLIVGIVRSKVMAILLAPAGVGIISQAFSFLTTASTVASLGLGVGISKFIPLYEHEKKNVLIKRALLISFLLHISISLLLVMLIIFFPKRISFMIFSTPMYAHLLIFVGLAIPCSTLVYFVSAAFVSLGKIKAFTLFRVRAYLTGLVPMFILIYFWGVRGGFIQIFLVAFTGFIFALYYFLKVIPREFYFPKNVHELSGLLPMGRKIFKYGLAMLATTALASLSILVVRSIIIHRMGTVANGYYQVLISFSAYYLPFFTNALWGHFYPRINSTNSSEEVSRELNNTVRFLCIAVTLCIAALLILKRYLVLLVFSNKFLNAIPYMESQFMGDFFSLFSIVFGCLVLAKGKIRIYCLNALFTNVVFISLSLLMFKHFAIFAVTLSYIIAQLMSTLFIYLYYNKYLKLYLSRTTLNAILSSLILLTVEVLLPDGGKNFYFKISALVLWFFVVIKKSERIAAIGLIKERLNWGSPIGL